MNKIGSIPLISLRALFEEAIRDGIPFEDFRERFEAMVKDESDPAGSSDPSVQDNPLTAERMIAHLKAQLGTSTDAEIFAAETLLRAFYTSSSPGYRRALLRGGLRWSKELGKEMLHKSADRIAFIPLIHPGYEAGVPDLPV